MTPHTPQPSPNSLTGPTPTPPKTQAFAHVGPLPRALSACSWAPAQLLTSQKSHLVTTWPLSRIPSPAEPWQCIWEDVLVRMKEELKVVLDCRLSRTWAASS